MASSRSDLKTSFSDAEAETKPLICVTSEWTASLILEGRPHGVENTNRAWRPQRSRPIIPGTCTGTQRVRVPGAARRPRHLAGLAAWAARSSKPERFHGLGLGANSPGSP